MLALLSSLFLAINLQQVPFTVGVIPFSIAVDSHGNAYVVTTATLPGEIDRVSPSGAVTPISTGAAGHLTMASDDALWAATDAGVTRFRPDGSRTIVPVNHVRAFAASRDAGVWLITDDKTMGVIDAAGAVSHFIADPIGDSRAIAAGPDGAIWLTGPNSEIARIGANGIVTRLDLRGIPAPRAIAAAADGTLWLANDEALLRIDAGGGIVDRVSLGAITVESMAIDASGALWLAGVDDVAVVRNGTLSSVKLVGPVPCALVRVYSIAERNGIVWAAALLEVAGPFGIAPAPSPECPIPGNVTAYALRVFEPAPARRHSVRR